MRAASVIIDGKTRQVDKDFTYRVPEELWDAVVVGVRVRVPFGGGNRHEVAFVIKVWECTDDEKVKDIAEVILVHSDGTQTALGLGGYLDVGLNDTMKDLIVNFIGAVVFSVIGFFYVKQKGKGRFAARFIPRVLRREEKEEL